MPDLGVFSRYKGFNDFQEEARKNSLAEALAVAQIAKAQQGGDLPAPLKLANEYQKRLQAGDIDGANQILMFAKAADRGLQTDASGNFQSAPGYAQAVGGIEGTKAGYKQQATKNVDLQMNPVIEKETSKAGVIGKDIGESEALLSSMSSRMPQLEDTAKRLSDLGKKATYTYAGQGRDAALRQAGLEVPESAVARTEYISMVDNEVLPLLRETFGAQFTQKEGESLKITLGDPNKTPQEKDAVLRSFIRSKKQTMDTTARKLGMGGLNSAQGGEVPLSIDVPSMNSKERAESIFNAKKALRSGKNPQAVRQKLMDAGINPAEAGL